jgi:antitoxin VapB
MLNIRNPEAAQLARELADMRKITMTEAVIEALKHEIARETDKVPLKERVRSILLECLGPDDFGGPGMTKEDIDAMWGH